MKNSKIVLFLAAFAFVVGITGCEVESEKHEHTFSKEWTSDAIAHWHAATCEHKTEISGIAAHTFGEWKVTKEATETHEGERQRTCSVCKYVEKETIAKLEHVHTFGEWIVTKEATESEEGEKERTCSVCKYAEKEIIARLEHVHTFGEWYVIIYPTETSNGKKERTCSVCKYVESFIIPSLEHTHDFREYWTNDETSHWHTCNGCSEVKDKAAHQWVDGKIMKWPTCKEEGIQTYSCSVCGITEERILPITEHRFGGYWYRDETKHWQKCSLCYENVCEASHQWDGKITRDPTCKEEGIKTYTCSICNEKKEERLPVLGHILSWCKYTSHYHVKKCERCGYCYTSRKEEHKWDLGKITTKSTHDTDGMKTYTCSVCNATEEEIIPAGHVFGDWTVTPATETTEGKTERVCTMCGYLDSETIPKIKDALKKVKGATFSGNQRWNPTSEIFANKNISIKSLYVSDHEVTRGEYKKIIGSDPSKLKARDENGKELNGDDVLNHPVDSVNWYEAIVYCNKLSKKEGLVPCYTIDSSTSPVEWGKVPHDSDSKWNTIECDFSANGYRLPTEEEWEYLARSGNPLGGYKYSGSNNLEDVAWSHNNCGYGNDCYQTREVKTKKANDLGLYDMTGNVYEWCWDSADYDDNQKQDSGFHRCRGGSMDASDLGLGGRTCYLEISARSRNRIFSEFSGENIGFRVVRTVTE